MLFHSLSDEARPVTSQNLARAGVKTIVHRTSTRGAFLQTLAAADRFAADCKVRNLPFSFYDDISRKLGGPSPTTGCVCLSFFLNAPVAVLAVTGFTFFTTSYVAGYDDSVTSDSASVQRIEDRNHHAPQLEARYVASLIEERRAQGHTIRLGDSVAQALGSVTASD